MIIPDQKRNQPEIYHIPNFLDTACLEYINHLKETSSWMDAWVGDGKDYDKSQKIRNTQNIIIDHDNDSDYLYKSLGQKFITANEKYFHYHVSSIIDVQILKYEIGCFYKAHLDIGGKVSNRKISLIAQLSDPSNYTGCDTILHHSYEPVVLDKTFNGGIFFPSYLLHEATPLLTGTRYALVAWACGEPFR
jgi:PKHD-type hydroxylase